MNLSKNRSIIIIVGFMMVEQRSL